MVGFTIQSITRTATGILVRTTTGTEVEFSGTPEEIQATLKAQVGDTDPNFLIKILLLRALHFDRELANPAQFVNKVVTYDVRQTSLITVL